MDNESVITIYGKPNCHACNATRTHLDTRAVPYIYIDITKYTEYADYLLDLGYREVPVVEISSVARWSGYRPDRLDELA